MFSFYFDEVNLNDIYKLRCFNNIIYFNINSTLDFIDDNIKGNLVSAV